MTSHPIKHPHFWWILHSLLHFGLLPTFHCAPSWSFRGRQFMNRKRPFWDLTPIFVFLFPILQAEKCSFENFRFCVSPCLLSLKGSFEIWHQLSALRPTKNGFRQKLVPWLKLKGPLGKQIQVILKWTLLRYVTNDNLIFMGGKINCWPFDNCLPFSPWAW